MKQLEEQQEMDPSPYALFVYSIRSPYTKETYFRRLRRFFDAISLEGPTFESTCNFFAEKGKQDPNWAFNSIFEIRIGGEATSRKKRNNRRNLKEFCKDYQDVL